MMMTLHPYCSTKNSVNIAHGLIDRQFTALQIIKYKHFISGLAQYVGGFDLLLISTPYEFKGPLSHPSSEFKCFESECWVQSSQQRVVNVIVRGEAVNMYIYVGFFLGPKSFQKKLLD